MAATQAARLSAAGGLACAPCVGPTVKCGSVYIELGKSRYCPSLSALQPTIRPLCRLADIFRKAATSRSVLQCAEHTSMPSKTEAVVKAWRLWASKQQAACEWLCQSLYDSAAESGQSQLDALKRQV